MEHVGAEEVAAAALEELLETASKPTESDTALEGLLLAEKLEVVATTEELVGVGVGVGLGVLLLLELQVELLLLLLSEALEELEVESSQKEIRRPTLSDWVGVSNRGGQSLRYVLSGDGQHTSHWT